MQWYAPCPFYSDLLSQKTFPLYKISRSHEHSQHGTDQKNPLLDIDSVMRKKLSLLKNMRYI